MILRQAQGGALDPELLGRIRDRAAETDRTNAFPTADLAELKAAGYLRPRPLAEVVADQRLLAAHAPGTALGLNMHLVWVGVARVLKERGDDSLDWVLRDAEAGEVFAFGISEPGNDQVLWDSETRAERVAPSADSGQPAGWAFTGLKIFTSLAPVWTRLGVFGKSEDGKLIHGFITRDPAGTEFDPAPGVHHLDDWNAFGMRASQSRSTRLDGAFVPDAQVSRILPLGPSADPFVFGIFSNFLLGLAAVYAGVADRALELAVAAVERRKSLRTGLPYADDPDFRWRIADMALALDPLEYELSALAAAVDDKVDYGATWFRRLTGAKHRATEAARVVVDQALRASGGGAFQADGELTRLQRDVLAGIYHPSDTESIHATVATALLGPISA